MSNVVFQNHHFSSLNAIVIFIILGIGADNIFVFMDGWKQTAAIEEIKHDKRKRLALAVKRAARATATTSSTTSAAFLANFFSPMMPFKSFGIYAAIIIAANYFFILLIFPPVAVWYDDNLKDKWCLCSKQETKVEVIEKVDAEEPKFGPMERFFGGPWNKMIKKFRFIIILAFASWTIAAIFFALRLTPLTKQEEFLPANHKLMKVQRLMT